MTCTVSPPTDRTRPLSGLFGSIASDLAEVERIFTDELASEVPYIRELVDHLASYRGKRLRPALLLLVGRACGRVTPDHHLLGAVVEMIHTATLVHDDVLDHAEVRRHVATINAAWDNSSSVLLGDLLYTHAFYLASTTKSTIACRLIGEATNRVCAGELRQIGERGNLELTEREYIEIIAGKTAELTACCCRLGALFSGASETTVESLTRYGRQLGIAFQIADDLLDLVGREPEAGKSLGTDLAQQKLTLPLIHLLRRAPGDLNRRLQDIISASGNHKQGQLLPYLEQSESLDYARAQAESYATRARQELGCLPNSQFRQILEDLTNLVVHRST